MIDFHSHTNLSYCSDRDLDLNWYVECLKQKDEMDAVAITDHGMAIYFPDLVAWAWEYVRDGKVFDKYKDAGNEKLESYISNLSKYKNKNIHCGLEVEMSQDGKLIYDTYYRNKLKPLIGSVHYHFITKKYGFSENEIVEFWLDHNKKLVESGIDILGHPLRWIATHAAIDDAMIDKIVEMADMNGVAIEINSHNMTNSIYEADKRMLCIAMDKGAKVSFGIDAHKKIQVGKFDYHRKLLKDCGVTLADLNLLTLKDLGL
ncbi:MAG: PHP domain-containing protein [Lentisphaerota bacterium]